MILTSFPSLANQTHYGTINLIKCEPYTTGKVEAADGSHILSTALWHLPK